MKSPLKPSFLAPLFLGFALCWLLGLLVYDNPGYEGWILSPYLLVISLAALRQGWLGGALAALVCFAGSAPSAASPFHQFVYCMLPALFLGGLAESNLRQLRRLRQSLVAQSAELVSAREQAEILGRANEELRAQLSQEQAGLATIYEVYRKLSTTDPQELQTAIIDVVSQSLGAEQCSLHLLQEGHLLRVMTRGWKSNESADSRRPLADDLLSLAVQEKQLKTLQSYPMERLNLAQRAALDEVLPLMACPLLHPGTGLCLGVLAIERLPFSLFNRSSAQLLETIAELAARALAELHSEETQVFGSDWHSREFLRRKLLAQLVAQKKGSRAPFSLLVVHFDQWDKLSASGARHLERALKLLFDATFRADDLRGRYQPGNFAVLLPSTDSARTNALALALQQEMKSTLGRWLPDLGRQCFEIGVCSSAGLEDPDELLAQALAGARQDEFAFAGPEVVNGESLELLQNQVQESPQDQELRHRLIRALLQQAEPESWRKAGEQFSLLRLMSTRV